jgi:hypothetical protein
VYPEHVQEKDYLSEKVGGAAGGSRGWGCPVPCSVQRRPASCPAYHPARPPPHAPLPPKRATTPSALRPPRQCWTPSCTACRTTTLARRAGEDAERGCRLLSPGGHGRKTAWRRNPTPPLRRHPIAPSSPPPPPPPRLAPPRPAPQVMTEHGRAGAYDRVRQTEVGLKDFDLKHLEEAFTSEHWIGAGAWGGGGFRAQPVPNPRGALDLAGAPRSPGSLLALSRLTACRRPAPPPAPPQCGSTRSSRPPTAPSAELGAERPLRARTLLARRRAPVPVLPATGLPVLN